MKDKSTAFVNLGLAGCLALALVSAPVAAGTPDHLEDLVYQDYGWGAQQLRHRGYTEISSDYHHGKTVEYWWSSAKNLCIRANANDNTGKYESISKTSATDCNQYHEEATKGDNAAAIAIGAAALIGAAVLAHQSHHRDDKHGDDSKSVAEFDRGYRDGLHHDRYDNYNGTEAYSDGYNAGQRDRDEKLAHRRSHSDSSLPPPTVDINKRDDAATVRFRGGCEVLFAPGGQMTKWSSFCTDQEKNAARRAYKSARAEKHAGPGDYSDI